MRGKKINIYCVKTDLLVNRVGITKIKISINQMNDNQKGTGDELIDAD